MARKDIPAAVAIDATGLGFNERRQDQTAADTAVMSGALGFILGEDDVSKVSKTLEVARANLDTTYTDHSGRPRFVVENGRPIRELI